MERKLIYILGVVIALLCGIVGYLIPGRLSEIDKTFQDGISEAVNTIAKNFTEQYNQNQELVIPINGENKTFVLK